MPIASPLPTQIPILLWNNKLRDRQCAVVSQFDESLHRLAESLKNTCYLTQGLGLAAPQISEFVRVCYVDYEIATAMVNPVIDEINSKGEQVDYEACLSIPTMQKVNARVRRCMTIEYSYQQLDGKRIEAKASGMLARVIQHEVDHLSGIFYVDRVGDLSRSLVVRSHNKWLAANQQLGSKYRSR